MITTRTALLIACAMPALALPPPANAQQVDPHAGHTMPAPASAPTPAPAPASSKKQSDPHAGHSMPDSQPAAADPHAGHPMPAEQGAADTGDATTGQAMPGMTAATPAGTDLPAGSAAAPSVPAEYAADAIYGANAMAMGRHHLFKGHGGQNFSMVLFNIAEAQFRDGQNGYRWEGEGWYGGDINRLVMKTEGEGAFGGPVEAAELQALYSRAVGPYFDVQAGIRYDFQPRPSRVYATVGVEGLAPGFFEVTGAIFLSDRGELLARMEGYYDQRITQRLILQPRAEVDLAAQSSRDIGIGKGLTKAELGLRLRYDIRREFAPYIGVEYTRAFGDTRDFLRAEGKGAGEFRFLAGIRTFF